MSGSIHSRRGFLGKMGAVSLAVPFMASCADKSSATNTQAMPSAKESKSNDYFCNMPKQTYDFFGKYQAGIATPQQHSVYFLVADLHSTDKAQIQKMFQDWTVFAEKLTKGQSIAPYGDNPYVPTTDTGEADDLSAYGLTLTFGISPSFLEKLGMKDKAPPEFSNLPLFPKDQLKNNLTGGDICIQACSDDMEVAFHAVRQLVRQARSLITMRWSQSGFIGYDDINQTPRNLFGFRDGTANRKVLENADKHLWVDKGWLTNGSYMVVRLIQMHLETWDRTSLKGQNETFGRHKDSGAGMGSKEEFDTLEVNAKDDKGELVIPDDAHAGLANRSGLELLRRSYSYSSGVDAVTGQFDAGLLFISFQKNPMQFVGIQSALGRIDAMNEYITHVGSGLFACFGGVEKGGYLGQALFEN